MHLDMPVLRCWCHGSEQLPTEIEDDPHAGTVSDRWPDRPEPALDVSLQSIVLQALKVWLVRFPAHFAVRLHRIRCVAAASMTAAQCEVGVRCKIAPAGHERSPVVQMLRLAEQLAHGLGGNEGKAVALQLGMKGRRVGW